MIEKWQLNPYACGRYIRLAGIRLFIAVGCQLHAKPTSSESSQAFILTLSKGGGFSGLTQGYTLHPNGRIERWQQFPLRDRTITASRDIDPKRVADFQQKLEASGILGMTLQATGNITTRVQYEIDQEQHTWSWADDSDSRTEPAALREWYRLVWNFCSQLFTNL